MVVVTGGKLDEKGAGAASSPRATSRSAPYVDSPAPPSDDSQGSSSGASTPLIIVQIDQLSQRKLSSYCGGLMDYKPGVKYCEKHTAWVDGHKYLGDIDEEFGGYEDLVKGVISSMDENARKYSVEIAKHLEIVKTGVKQKGFLFPGLSRESFLAIAAIIVNSDSFKELKEKLTNSSRLNIGYHQYQINSFLSYLEKQKFEKTIGGVDKLPPPIAQKISDCKFESLRIAARSLHDKLKNVSKARSIDSSKITGPADSEVKKYQVSALFNLDVARKQIYAARGERGYVMNIAMHEPALEEFQSEFNPDFTIPSEEHKHLISRGQLQALKDIDRAFSRGVKDDGVVGKAEIRLATGRGKTYLSKLIKEFYGDKVHEISKVDLNSFDKKIDELIAYANGSKKVPNEPNKVNYISIDESFFFAKYFREKFTNPDIAKKNPPDFTEEDYLEIETQRFSFLRNLRKNGIIVITLGASEVLSKVEIEELRNEDKLLALEFQIEESKRLLRVESSRQGDEKMRKVLKSFFENFTSIEMPSKPDPVDLYMHDIAKPVYDYIRKIDEDSFASLGGKFHDFAHEVFYSKKTDIFSLEPSEFACYIYGLLVSDKYRGLLDGKRPKVSVAKLKVDINELEQEKERRQGRLDAKKDYRQDLEDRQNDVYKKINSSATKIVNPIEGGDAIDQIVSAIPEDQGGFMQYVTDDSLEGLWGDDSQATRLLEQGNFDAAVTGFVGEDGVLRHRVFEKGSVKVVETAEELNEEAARLKKGRVLSVFANGSDYIGGDNEGFSFNVTFRALKLSKDATVNDYMQGMSRKRDLVFADDDQGDDVKTDMVIISTDDKDSLTQRVKGNSKKEELKKTLAYIRSKSKDGSWYHAFREEERCDKDNVYDHLLQIAQQKGVEAAIEIWREAIGRDRALVYANRDQDIDVQNGQGDAVERGSKGRQGGSSRSATPQKKGAGARGSAKKSGKGSAKKSVKKDGKKDTKKSAEKDSSLLSSGGSSKTSSRRSSRSDSSSRSASSPARTPRQVSVSVQTDRVETAGGQSQVGSSRSSDAATSTPVSTNSNTATQTGKHNSVDGHSQTSTAPSSGHGDHALGRDTDSSRSRFQGSRSVSDSSSGTSFEGARDVEGLRVGIGELKTELVRIRSLFEDAIARFATISDSPNSSFLSDSSSHEGQADRSDQADHQGDRQRDAFAAQVTAFQELLDRVKSDSENAAQEVRRSQKALEELLAKARQDALQDRAATQEEIKKLQAALDRFDESSSSRLGDLTRAAQRASEESQRRLNEASDSFQALSREYTSAVENASGLDAQERDLLTREIARQRDLAEKQATQARQDALEAKRIADERLAQERESSKNARDELMEQLAQARGFAQKNQEALMLQIDQIRQDAQGQSAQARRNMDEVNTRQTALLETMLERFETSSTVDHSHGDHSNADLERQINELKELMAKLAKSEEDRQRESRAAVTKAEQDAARNQEDLLTHLREGLTRLTETRHVDQAGNPRDDEFIASLTSQIEYLKGQIDILRENSGKERAENADLIREMAAKAKIDMKEQIDQLRGILLKSNAQANADLRRSVVQAQDRAQEAERRLMEERKLSGEERAVLNRQAQEERAEARRFSEKLQANLIEQFNQSRLDMSGAADRQADLIRSLMQEMRELIASVQPQPNPNPQPQPNPNPHQGGEPNPDQGDNPQGGDFVADFMARMGGMNEQWQNILTRNLDQERVAAARHQADLIRQLDQVRENSSQDIGRQIDLMRELLQRMSDLAVSDRGDHGEGDNPRDGQGDDPRGDEFSTELDRRVVELRRLITVTDAKTDQVRTLLERQERDMRTLTDTNARQTALLEDLARRVDAMQMVTNPDQDVGSDNTELLALFKEQMENFRAQLTAMQESSKDERFEVLRLSREMAEQVRRDKTAEFDRLAQLLTVSNEVSNESLRQLVAAVQEQATNAQRRADQADERYQALLESHRAQMTEARDFFADKAAQTRVTLTEQFTQEREVSERRFTQAAQAAQDFQKNLIEEFTNERAAAARYQEALIQAHAREIQEARKLSQDAQARSDRSDERLQTLLQDHREEMRRASGLTQQERVALEKRFEIQKEALQRESDRARQDAQNLQAALIEQIAEARNSAERQVRQAGESAVQAVDRQAALMRDLMQEMRGLVSSVQPQPNPDSSQGGNSRGSDFAAELIDRINDINEKWKVTLAEQFNKERERALVGKEHLSRVHEREVRRLTEDLRRKEEQAEARLKALLQSHKEDAMASARGLTREEMDVLTRQFNRQGDDARERFAQARQDYLNFQEILIRQLQSTREDSAKQASEANDHHVRILGRLMQHMESLRLPTDNAPAQVAHPPHPGQAGEFNAELTARLTQLQEQLAALQGRFDESGRNNENLIGLLGDLQRLANERFTATDRHIDESNTHQREEFNRRQTDLMDRHAREIEVLTQGFDRRMAEFQRQSREDANRAEQRHREDLARQADQFKGEADRRAEADRRVEEMRTMFRDQTIQMREEMERLREELRLLRERGGVPRNDVPGGVEAGGGEILPEGENGYGILQPPINNPGSDNTQPTVPVNPPVVPNSGPGSTEIITDPVSLSTPSPAPARVSASSSVELTEEQLTKVQNFVSGAANAVFKRDKDSRFSANGLLRSDEAQMQEGRERKIIIHLSEMLFTDDSAKRKELFSKRANASIIIEFARQISSDRELLTGTKFATAIFNSNNWKKHLSDSDLSEVATSSYDFIANSSEEFNLIKAALPIMKNNRNTALYNLVNGSDGLAGSAKKGVRTESFDYVKYNEKLKDVNSSVYFNGSERLASPRSGSASLVA